MDRLFSNKRKNALWTLRTQRWLWFNCKDRGRTRHAANLQSKTGSMNWPILQEGSRQCSTNVYIKKSVFWAKTWRRELNAFFKLMNKVLYDTVVRQMWTKLTPLATKIHGRILRSNAPTAGSIKYCPWMDEVWESAVSAAPLWAIIGIDIAEVSVSQTCLSHLTI